MAAVTTWPIQHDERGVAWIEGTTTKVKEIVLVKLASGLSPEEVQTELPHLTIGQVYAALAYYHANQAEMDAEIERDRLWAEEMRARNPNPWTREELLARLGRR